MRRTSIPRSAPAPAPAPPRSRRPHLESPRSAILCPKYDFRNWETLSPLQKTKSQRTSIRKTMPRHRRSLTRLLWGHLVWDSVDWFVHTCDRRATSLSNYHRRDFHPSLPTIETFPRPSKTLLMPPPRLLPPMNRHPRIQFPQNPRLPRNCRKRARGGFRMTLRSTTNQGTAATAAIGVTPALKRSANARNSPMSWLSDGERCKRNCRTSQTLRVGRIVERLVERPVDRRVDQVVRPAVEHLILLPRSSLVMPLRC